MAGSRRGRLDPRTLRTLWLEGPMAVRSDADLVRLFLDAHGEAAEAAFEALVARHGPMVLGVCRRILRDEHEAEDAFQAVFLILARKARSVRVDDSLGRWLHGVTRRVAVRAKDMGSREIAPSSSPDRAPGDPTSEVARAEVRQLIALEVARLPRKYREVVALCHIDGLGHDDAAEALGVPVGTVRSRLSRARDYLRPRLVRRGLAPSALVAWLGERRAVAEVPKALLEITLRNAGGVATVAIMPTVLALADHAMRSLTMAKAMGAGALMAALGCLATGAVVMARGGDEPAKATIQAAKDPEPKQVTAPSTPLEDQFRRIIREYHDAKNRAGKIVEKGKTEYERWKTYFQVSPDETDYARRIVDLAATRPKDLASRDALIWVMYQPHRSDMGAYGDEFARAARLLVIHHADDPEVARVGLGFENVLTRRRDAFLEEIYANAQGREAKGLIRMALARYLAVKAQAVTGSRNYTARGYIRSPGYDDQGNKVEKTTSNSNEDEGYRVYSRMLDADYVRAESERLFEEVIADYADVPYITTGYREMERKARETPSNTITDPEKKRAMVETEDYLAKKKIPTLGKVAAARLDDMRNLAVGKVAPEFEGQGADGKPIKLSDYKGKVVVLAYWFSTCGPCLGAIPDERKLTEKMKGRPFTLLGIVTDGRADNARKVIESEKMNWPNVVVGGDKVAERYHITGNPSYFVLDAAGVIHAKGHLLASDLDKLAEQLVVEAEGATKPAARE